MSSESESIAAPPNDEASRYTHQSILRSERMYGHGFQSPGQRELVDRFCERLPDLRGKRILDIGSGLGGAAFHLNERYGAIVDGLDNAAAMIEISMERATETSGVKFIHGDIRTTPFDPQSYDVAWSRDCILYISEKSLVWEKIAQLLRPGGWLFVTDFCRRQETLSADFAVYLKQCGYYLRDIESYAADIAAHGLVVQTKEDMTPLFVEYLIREKAALEADRSAFLSEFSQVDYLYLVERWEKKRRFCDSGNLRWGVFVARKPF